MSMPTPPGCAAESAFRGLPAGAVVLAVALGMDARLDQGLPGAMALLGLLAL